jgi:hypothetical protein
LDGVRFRMCRKRQAAQCHAVYNSPEMACFAAPVPNRRRTRLNCRFHRKNAGCLHTVFGASAGKRNPFGYSWNSAFQKRTPAAV